MVLNVGAEDEVFRLLAELADFCEIETYPLASNRGANLMFCETEDDLRRADAALNQMTPASGRGARTSVEMYEVALDERPAGNSRVQVRRGVTSTCALGRTDARGRVVYPGLLDLAIRPLRLGDHCYLTIPV